MTEFHWPTLRDKAIGLFREPPSASLEQKLVEHFAERPATVDSMITTVAAAHREGKIRSPWPVLLRRLNDSAKAPDLTATDESEKRTRIANARTWIRNAGCLYDLQRHVEAELFGDDFGSGYLEAYADDNKLRAQLLEFWVDQRATRGRPSEQAAEEYMKKCGDGWKTRAEALERKRRARTGTEFTDTPEPATAASGETPWVIP